jgi:flagellar protein FliS
MNPNALHRYRSVQINTSSPGVLLMMLLDGLMRFLGEASTAMRAGDRGRAGERISRSHAILDELNATLKPEAAPELCERLRGIYLFCMGHLVRSNVEQDPNMIDEVVRILKPIRDAFQTAHEQVRPTVEANAPTANK